MPRYMRPYDYAFACFGGKWKAIILHGIYVEQPVRFSRCLSQMPISEKMLSQCLRELIELGLVSKKVYAQTPPKVEYSLTPTGESLIPVMDAVYGWSAEQMRLKGLEIEPRCVYWHERKPGDGAE